MAHMQEVNILVHVSVGTYIAYKISLALVHSCSLNMFSGSFTHFPCICEALTLYSPRFACTNIFHKIPHFYCSDTFCHSSIYTTSVL